MVPARRPSHGRRGGARRRPSALPPSLAPESTVVDLRGAGGGFSATWNAERSVLVLRGELDVATVPTLEAAIDEWLPTHNLVIDARELSFVDARGLGALLTAEEEAAAHRRRVCLLSPSAALRRLIALCESDGHFVIVG